jgi:hypothetical protein
VRDRRRSFVWKLDRLARAVHGQEAERARSPLKLAAQNPLLLFKAARRVGRQANPNCRAGPSHLLDDGERRRRLHHAHVAAVNAMMLDMLAAVARKDYEDRRRRQAQGQAKAKAEGK